MNHAIQELDVDINPSTVCKDSTQDKISFTSKAGFKGVIDNSLMHIPNGIKVATTSLGVKDSGAADFTVMLLEEPGNVAGVFTKSRSASPNVARNREIVKSGVAQAVVVNSGNANVFTPTATEDLNEISELVAAEFNVAPEKQIICQTGVIGVELPMDKFRSGVPGLSSKLTEGDLASASEGILTTDVGPKVASFKFGDVIISGIAKGAGMIEPNMATMLVYFFTNAKLSSEKLLLALRNCTDVSFNCISVDTDTSTSDSVVLVSTNEVEPSVDEEEVFNAALKAMCVKLAKDVVSQGEGVTKTIEAKVATDESYEFSHALAKSIINSPLVKTAIHGGDPNWGRIVMALGKPIQGFQDAPGFDPSKVKITLQGITVFNGMQPCNTNFAKLSESMQDAKDIYVDVSINNGRHIARAWGCNLSNEYIHINADYTS